MWSFAQTPGQRDKLSGGGKTDRLYVAVQLLYQARPEPLRYLHHFLHTPRSRETERGSRQQQAL
jgi:hypothetical protein